MKINQRKGDMILSLRVPLGRIEIGTNGELSIVGNEFVIAHDWMDYRLGHCIEDRRKYWDTSKYFQLILNTNNEWIKCILDGKITVAWFKRRSGSTRNIAWDNNELKLALGLKAIGDSISLVNFEVFHRLY